MDTTRASLLARLKELESSHVWSEFDEIYRPLLRRYAAAWGLQGSDAEEVAQECMILLWRRMRKFEYDPARGRFRAWLQRVVANRVKSRYRRRREAQIQSGELRALVSGERPADEVYARIWQEEHVRGFLQQIRREVESHTFRAFELYVIERQSVEQVCQELGVTPNQVYKSKWRVTQKLAEKMKRFEA